MPDPHQPTLRLVLGLEPDGEKAGATLLDESGDALRELRAKMEGGVPAALLRPLREELQRRVAEACDIPLASILAGAWSKYRPLREYCDPGKHPPGESATVPLATHTVSSVQHPTVELLIGEKSVYTLRLDAKITLEIEGAVLTLRDGMFRELATGTSQAKASLHYGAALLAVRDLGEYELPGRISFGDGIPICPDLSRSASPAARGQAIPAVPIFGGSAEQASGANES